MSIDRTLARRDPPALAAARRDDVAGVRAAHASSRRCCSSALPFSGDGPDGFVGALLLAMALNLVVVAALAPARRDRCCAAAAPTCRGRSPPTWPAPCCSASLFGALVVAGPRQPLGASAPTSAPAPPPTPRRPTYVHAPGARLRGVPRRRGHRPRSRSASTAAASRPAPSRPLCLFVNTDQSPAGRHPRPRPDPQLPRVTDRRSGELSTQATERARNAAASA